MKLSIVIPVLNQFPLARVALEYARNNLSLYSDVEFIILDNGSDIPFRIDPSIATVYRKDAPYGSYPCFWWGLSAAQGDIIAFIHSDLIITEVGWDKRVLEEFKKNENLGLLGFIGSNEIDIAGGRGLGTTSNFQGKTYTLKEDSKVQKIWEGSPASVHGAQNSGYTKAAVIDGCAMVFRKSVLERISQRADFPPHHFYDRLLSCEVREMGYEIGVLGIGCDHISGQTVNQEPKYHELARAWIAEHMPVDLTKPQSYDSLIYKEAERQWLTEYRDQKHLVPYRV